MNKAAGLESKAHRKRKPKKRKGPNPLSVKKSQRSFVRDKVIGGGVVSRSKVGGVHFVVAGVYILYWIV